MRTRILMIAALLLALAAPVSAGDLGIFGSYWETDDLNDTGGLGVKYALGDGALRLEFRGSYYPDLTRDFETLVESGTGEVKVEALVPEAGVTFNFAPGANTQIYAGAGLSYYLLEEGRLDIDDQAGYYGLLGLVTGGGGDGVGFFAELLYRSVEASVRDNALVESFDLDLSGPSVNVGVIWRF